MLCAILLFWLRGWSRIANDHLANKAAMNINHIFTQERRKLLLSFSFTVFAVKDTGNDSRLCITNITANTMER